MAVTVGVFALAVSVLGTGVATAGAETASIQAALNDDGSGEMIANSQLNPEGEAWSWEACTPGPLACSAFGSGRIVQTAGAGAPTVFRATSNRGPSALSPVWHGNVFSTSPPSISGTVRANELVTPAPGEWSGGWEGDVDWTQLAACPTPAGVECTTLTDRHYVDSCPNGAAVIDPAFTGDYLRVADQRMPAHTPEPLYAAVSPYGSDTWAEGPTVSVAIVGRIARANGAREGDCGPPPLTEASISRRGVARVECGLGCNAVLVARRGNREARVTRRLAAAQFPEAPEPVTLRLSRRALTRLGPGRARMVVKIDGRRAARRAIVLR